MQKIIWYFIVILSIAFILRLIPSKEIELTKDVVMSPKVEVPKIINIAHADPIPEEVKRKKKIAITRENVFEIMDKLAHCESRTREGIKILDTNGYYSYGMFQYQSSTWALFSRESGLSGSPLNRQDTINMTRWALLNGKASHWFNCAKSIGIL